MKIGGFQKFSLIDFPSQISAIIFTQGCNYRCPYCHNPELVLPELFTGEMSVENIMTFLKDRQGRLDGVVITGGEPTIHADLPEFIKSIRDIGYKIKLDTNGTNPEMIKKLISEKLVDFIAMDIKAPFEKYEKLVGVPVSIDSVRSSMDFIKSAGIPYEFRTTVYKHILNDKDVDSMKAMLSGTNAVFKDVNPATKVLSEVIG